MREIVKGLIVAEDGPYLMQLRDGAPHIRFHFHWALFGGVVEPGEDQEAGLRRELAEELEFAAGPMRWFTELTFLLPQYGINPRRLVIYEAQATAAEIAAMRQHEGADKRLMTVAELMAEPKVIPWDLYAVILHGRTLHEPTLRPPHLDAAAG